jgi:LysM repeat protein
MPSVTLSLPVLVGLLIVLVGAGGGGVYFFTRPTPTLPGIAALPTATATITPTITITFTPTSTSLPTSTVTPIPPKEYTVKEGDYCSTIAYAFGVPINLIIQANSNQINSDCTNLAPGMKLLIPVPTPTSPPLPTSTPNAAQATESSCVTVDYQVKEGDTMGSIAANYNVPAQAIKDWNGRTSDTVFSGETLKIPTCKAYPTPGPTPTATPPPPYPAANLLLPADGAAFVQPGDVITLQWSTVGTLRQNEAYAVTIEDLTSGSGEKYVDYVTDTKYIVPATLRPADPSPHIFRWTVLPVRQTGSNKDGQPIYVPGGQVSAARVFCWIGGLSGPTPTP